MSWNSLHESFGIDVHADTIAVAGNVGKATPYGTSPTPPQHRRNWLRSQLFRQLRRCTKNQAGLCCGKLTPLDVFARSAMVIVQPPQGEVLAVSATIRSKAASRMPSATRWSSVFWR